MNKFVIGFVLVIAAAACTNAGPARVKTGPGNTGKTSGSAWVTVTTPTGGQARCLQSEQSHDSYSFDCDWVEYHMQELVDKIADEIIERETNR